MEIEIKSIENSEQVRDKFVEVKRNKCGRPKKDNTLRGLDYYNANHDKILEQKKEYRTKNADKIKGKRDQVYLKKKQEEYKATHNGSLDGFKIRQYNRIRKQN